ncbi:TetR family transcriptional regulator [Actinomycetospora sp. NBRC 106378]|jgi:AcrR family transcriptional regulator|uniref:TetR/AcrR family transcriptional regulator n=1 Tax=Actinomycetospora sp. NBRC 106378 TaxID=3032208 RepID=UPI0024A55CD4|nr:TetR family transcriptional regulator [Actinomycetospora sp. NBRC 106378]GLZ51971.1 putative transcriptional regulator, TetR family protein [Actinomycetospora sp. NBRC 106378]
MTGESLRVEFRRQVRERVLDTAASLAVEHGWDRVRIGEVATTSGVSRPTLYREFGTKDGVGEALVAREAERFFTGIASVLEDSASVPDGVGASVRFTLDEAADNPLLRAILTGSRSGDTGLLPFLTTRGDAIISGGTGLVGAWVRRRAPEVEGRVVDDAVDAVVRLTISHLVSPGLSHADAADRLARIAACLLCLS